MKDYQKIYRVCIILDSYQDDDHDYNLNASHDTLHFCFDVKPEQLSAEHAAKLKEMRVHHNPGLGVWEMNCSC